MSGTVQAIDHPADTGIEVWADTLPELFELAVQGLMNTAVVHPQAIIDSQQKIITATGNDLPELMINFLSEFLYLIDTENFVIARCRVAELQTKIPPLNIQAAVGGEIFDSQRHSSATDIKAITYHQMIIEQSGNQWHAKIIFDI
ncbi:MAG: archease [Patescibacteria group bacterium]